LHSRMAKNREVLKELERTLSAPAPQATWHTDTFAQVESLKADLNAYAKALREPFGQIQYSPFALFCIQETARCHFAEAGRPIPRVVFPNPAVCDPHAWSTTVAQLRDLAEALPLVMPLAKHPWRGCDPGTILPSDEEEIGTLIEACRDALHALEEAVDRLANACAIQYPATPEALPHAIAAARVMAASTPVDRQVLLNDVWNRPSEEAEGLIRKVEAVQQELAKVRAKFTTHALTRDIAALLDGYKLLSAKFLRFFNRRYRSCQDTFAKLLLI
jgi:hypothetical protein